MGMKIYLVGGAVRDRLLGVESADLDFVVLGGSEDALLRTRPGLIRVGQGIPVFLRGNAQYTLSGYTCIEEDLASRDLTINALAEDEDGGLIAHPLAQSDLRDKILRPVAQVNFLADPLRAVRAARFAAVLPGFSVHPDLLAAMRAVSSQALGAVAAERVGHELLKACASPRPGNFLRILRDGECLAPWFVEFFCGVDDSPGSVSTSLERAVTVMDGSAGDPLSVWMALCQALDTAGGEQESQGETHAETLARRLRLPNRYLTAGRLAARWGRAGRRYRDLGNPDKVRLLLSLDTAGIMDPFFRVMAECGGGDQLDLARRDLDCIRAVRLPEEFRNLGPTSAEILLRLRSDALS